MTPFWGESLKGCARDLAHTVLNSAWSLCTTDNLHLLIIVGGYLLLRPRLQHFFGTVQTSYHTQPMGTSLAEAKMPNSSCDGIRPSGNNGDNKESTGQRVGNIGQGENSMR